ncbi:hypothetical protein J6590_079827 [Homalodisca vitripennis]|nr:hypothetical protein J6590_079827 [Homalodisca vitripennis]
MGRFLYVGVIRSDRVQFNGDVSVSLSSDVESLDLPITRASMLESVYVHSICCSVLLGLSLLSEGDSITAKSLLVAGRHAWCWGSEEYTLCFAACVELEQRIVYLLPAACAVLEPHSHHCNVTVTIHNTTPSFQQTVSTHNFQL